MLTLILGESGTGKTTCVSDAIREDIASGRHVYLIVPEQQTVAVEREMANLLPANAPILFEVTNFTRLCDTVFRLHGGLAGGVCTPAVEQLLMWRCLSELSPLLRNKIEAEPKNIAKMRATVKELRGMKLTPATLNAAALQCDGTLADKLKDYALILGTYHALLAEHAGDSDDRMDRMAELLSTHPFPADTRFYIDNFSSFTEQEYGVIEALLRHSDVTLTLCIPPHIAKQLSGAEVDATHRALLTLAAKYAVKTDIRHLTTHHRLTDPARAYIAEHLFRVDYATLPPYNGGASDALRLIECPDPQDSCDFIAADIRSRVQNEGLKYADFAIVCGTSSSYTGILDASLETYDIPYFFMRKRDLLTLEPIKMMLLAYAVITGGWRTEHVIAYLKCAPVDIAADARDELELYAEMWRIRGAAWYDEHAWNMNPFGYGEAHTEGQRTYAAAKLARVNAARERLISPLVALSDGVKEPLTVTAHVRVLTEFLLSLSLPTYLDARADVIAAADKVRAAEYARLWDSICDALDTLTATIGDTTLTAEEFAALLKMLFSTVKLGAIPAGLDEVTVGDARMLRTGGVKYAYLLGANEGEFPPPPAVGGAFSATERTALEVAGLALADTTDTLTSRELFSFWRAMNMASDGVTLLWSRAGITMESVNPSDAVIRIRRLLGQDYPITHITSQHIIRNLSTVTAAGEHIGAARGTDEGVALANLLSRTAHADDVTALSTPLCNSHSALSPTMAQTLFPGDLAMTQSRIQKFKECPFSYFCRHILKLDDGGRAEFDSGNIGTFLHAVFEGFFGAVKRRGYDPHDIPGEVQEDILTAVLSEVIRKTLPAGEENNPRTRALLSNLTQYATAVVASLCDEMRHTRFTPAFFELSIDTKNPDTPTPVAFDLPGGNHIYIFGSIDRVDTYVKDDRAYIRVVDYKTGTKDFSLADIENGVNLQLLLYLFSVLETDNADFRRALGISDAGEILPAAVLYLSSLTRGSESDHPIEGEDAFREAVERPSRSGLVLHDTDIITALDDTPELSYLPLAYKKDGTFKAASMKSLTDIEALGQLKTKIGEILCDLGGAMKRGDATAAPMTTGHIKPCERCSFRSVCRFTAPDKIKRTDKATETEEN